MADTEQFPELHAETWEDDIDEFGNCIECGEPAEWGQHDRCCSIGYDEWCAAVDLQIGE